MKYLKATWIGSDPGGHVSINGCEEFLDELRPKPGGGRVHRRGTVADSIVVTPCMDNGDDEQVHERTKTRLLAGEFMIQDTPNNKQIMKDHVKAGFIQMDDWDLHYEMLEEEPKYAETIEEEVVKNVVVETDITPENSPAALKAKKAKQTQHIQELHAKDREEKEKLVAEFECLKSVKMRKEEIIKGVIDKGIKTMEDLANTNRDILLSINFVGDKVADGMIEEAKALTGGSQEE